jgi:lysophospholipase L1-like esterase
MLLISRAFAGAILAMSTAFAVAQVSSDTLAAPATVLASDSNYAKDFRYQVQFADYVALRRQQPADLIFIGDSITEQFRWGPGNSVWKAFFEQRALNFGKGGDRTQHVLWRLDNQAVDWISPKAAVLLIGTNNQQDAPEEIAQGVKAIITKIKSKWPNAKILLLSILPNGRQTERMAAANKLLPALADQKRVAYLDVTQRFPKDGDNWKGLQADKLHLTTQAYEGLAEDLNGALSKLLKD